MVANSTRNGLPVLYFFLYARYGFEDKDTGFILGNCWQVLTGGTLYTDILYVRPPVSVLFHLLSFCAPDAYVVLFDRSLFYVEIFVSSLLIVKLLGKAFDVTDGRHLAFATALGFVISAHNFPPMAWHTVDGVFLCSIGLACVFEAKRPFSMRVFLGGAFVLLGLMCKQSFYPMSIGLLTCLFLNRDAKRAFCALGGMLLVIAVFYIWFLNVGALQGYVAMTSGETSFSDLFTIGIYSYIKDMDKLPLFFGPAVVAVAVAWRYARSYAKPIAFIVLFLWVLTYSWVEYAKRGSFMSPPDDSPDALFIGAALFVIVKWLVGREERYLKALVFLLLTWSCSISWGYQTTVLGFTPVVFIYGLLLRDAFSHTYVKWGAVAVLAIAILTFRTAGSSMYTLDHPGLRRSDVTYDMSQVSPRLTGIYADRETYEQYRELMALVNERGERFTVLPSCTLAHFITQTQNPIGSDWPMNAEINGQTDLLMSRLRKNANYVLIERREIVEEGKWGSALTVRVMKEWMKVEEGKYFDVYEPGN